MAQALFDAGKFEQRLGDALPLDVLQPVLVQPTAGAMETEGGTSSSSDAGAGVGRVVGSSGGASSSSS